MFPSVARNSTGRRDACASDDGEVGGSSLDELSECSQVALRRGARALGHKCLRCEESAQHASELEVTSARKCACFSLWAYRTSEACAI